MTRQRTLSTYRGDRPSPLAELTKAVAKAQVAELVDALVSGTSAARRGGSSPLLGTNNHELQKRPRVAVAPVRSKAATTGGLATHKECLGDLLRKQSPGTYLKVRPAVASPITAAFVLAEGDAGTRPPVVFVDDHAGRCFVEKAKNQIARAEATRRSRIFTRCRNDRTAPKLRRGSRLTTACRVDMRRCDCCERARPQHAAHSNPRASRRRGPARRA